MTERPNILFLLSDEHSYRFVSARTATEGGEPCRTPTLDGLLVEADTPLYDADIVSRNIAADFDR